MSGPTPTVEARLRRLLAVLGWLSRRKGASIADIALRFGMSEDEVVAELELAACCGLPPYTPDQLMEVLVDDQRVEANLGADLARPRRLSGAEGFAVAASARAILAVPGADPDGALARALDKLESALGEHRKVTVDLDEPPLLAEVRRAVEGHRQLRISYYSASRDEVTDRVVDPLAVFSSGGRWYLDAHCHRAGGLRHFRVDRIESAHPTGETFEAPAPRAVPTEVFEPGPDVRVATILLPASAASVTDSYPVRSMTTAGDGRVRVEVAVGGEAWLARLLLVAGEGAEVVSPPELTGVGPRAAAAVLARYR
ncbi:MAG TPA: WYL domain-containing protein [Acidimicrobiales bacterium]|nr:WYL domain-containing protein [Acidimicrobiales bacterium]